MEKKVKKWQNMSLFEPFFRSKRHIFDQKCRFGVLIEKRGGMIKKKGAKQKNTIARFSTVFGITCNGRYSKTLEHKSRQTKIMRELSLLNYSAEIQILRASEPANTRRLHATEFATTSAITSLQLESAKPTKAEPPR